MLASPALALVDASALASSAPTTSVGSAHSAARRAMSHRWPRRCSRDVDRRRIGGAAAAVALAGSGPDGAAADRRVEADEHMTASGSIGGAVRGDLAEIFLRDYGLVVGVAARVLDSRDEAEDVAQEVFLSFARSSVPSEEARGWLSVAAAHTALNLLRSRRRRRSREESNAAVHDAVAPDVADAVVTHEDRRRVRAALGRLPRKQAVALVLRHSGLSYVEVAAALELSPNSVGTTVRRAESALRKELNSHGSSS
jgi:RNA polymerase sigma factor (sigma-70 family)